MSLGTLGASLPGSPVTSYGVKRLKYVVKE